MAGIDRGRHSETVPPVLVAALPLVVVIGVNFLMAMVLLPRLDTFLPGGGALGHHLAAGGRWRVGGGGALAAAILTLIVVNRRRLPALRQSMDAGANASVLPAVSVASLVGFGAVVAALPAFAMVREAVLSIGGGPLVSLAAATNVSPR
jgi:H+/gluconate symporter-like permease